MNKKPYKMIIAVSIIFISGICIGAASTCCFLKSRFDKMRYGTPQDREEHMMCVLDWKLKLDDQQEERIRPIIRKVGIDLQDLRSQLQPKIMVILDKGYEDISVELTDQQKIKCKTFHEKMKSNWQCSIPGN